MPPRKKAIKKKIKTKTIKKAVRKKPKKTVKKILKKPTKFFNLPPQNLQKLPKKPSIRIKQDPFLTTISTILKVLALLILVIGILSSLFSWAFYSWWVGLLIFILIWIISNSMKHW